MQVTVLFLFNVALWSPNYRYGRRYASFTGIHLLHLHIEKAQLLPNDCLRARALSCHFYVIVFFYVIVYFRTEHRLGRCHYFTCILLVLLISLFGHFTIDRPKFIQFDTRTFLIWIQFCVQRYLLHCFLQFWHILQFWDRHTNKVNRSPQALPTRRPVVSPRAAARPGASGSPGTALGAYLCESQSDEAFRELRPVVFDWRPLQCRSQCRTFRSPSGTQTPRHCHCPAWL